MTPVIRVRAIAFAFVFALLAAACTSSGTDTGGGSSPTGSAVGTTGPTVVPETPSEGITPDNVGSLELSWYGKPAFAAVPANYTNPRANFVQAYPPIVSGGLVYVAAADGRLIAYREHLSVWCQIKASPGLACVPLWVGQAGGAILKPAVVAGGIAYVATQGGELDAFAADCEKGGATCDPLWVADTGGAIETPVAAKGVVYALDPVAGTVYAFAADCGTGGATCDPLWTAPTEPSGASASDTHIIGSFRLTLSDGVVYAVGVKALNFHRLYAFDAATGEQLWYGDPTDPVVHGTPDETPYVHDGLVYIFQSSSTPQVVGFPVGCRTDGGRCEATWIGPGNGFNWAVDGGTVFQKGPEADASGTISAFDVACGSGGGTCAPTWTAPDVGDGELLTGDGIVLSSSMFGGTLAAFPESCGAGTCSAMWQANVSGPRTPVIANGVVYVAVSERVYPTEGGGLEAFSTSCGTDGATCEPIWTAPGVHLQTTPPAIDGDMLFAASLDGTLYAFALPGAS